MNEPGYSVTMNYSWDSSGVLMNSTTVENFGGGSVLDENLTRVMSTNGIPQALPVNSSTFVNGIVDGLRLSYITVNTTMPVQMIMNFTVTVPSDVTLKPNADEYFQLIANDTSAISFPLTLTVYYNTSELAAVGLSPSNLTIWWYDTTNSSWVPLNSTVNTTDQTITVVLNHFSLYTISFKPSSSTIASKTKNSPSILGFEPVMVSIVGFAAITWLYETIRRKILLNTMRC
jgi:hypothetical protein